MKILAWIFSSSLLFACHDWSYFNIWYLWEENLLSEKRFWKKKRLNWKAFEITVTKKISFWKKVLVLLLEVSTFFLRIAMFLWETFFLVIFLPLVHLKGLISILVSGFVGIGYFFKYRYRGFKVKTKLSVQVPDTCQHLFKFLITNFQYV